MSDKKLYSMKEIAIKLGVNYKTLLSCKDRFGDSMYGVQCGRVTRFSEDYIDFFQMIFALLDEGYSTIKINELLLSGVESEDDAFIGPWLESRLSDLSESVVLKIYKVLFFWTSAKLFARCTIIYFHPDVTPISLASPPETRYY